MNETMLHLKEKAEPPLHKSYPQDRSLGKSPEQEYKATVQAVTKHIHEACIIYNAWVYFYHHSFYKATAK